MLSTTWSCYCRSLQEGDLALFMAHRPRDSGHSKENYLAFTFDGRLYYLDADSAKLFRQDLTYLSSALGKRWVGQGLGTLRCHVFVRCSFCAAPARPIWVEYGPRPSVKCARCVYVCS